MSGPVNRKFNFCELKLDHDDFIDRSQNEVFADRRSIDRSMSDDQIGDSIMIAQPCQSVTDSVRYTLPFWGLELRLSLSPVWGEKGKPEKLTWSFGQSKSHNGVSEPWPGRSVETGAWAGRREVSNFQWITGDAFIRLEMQRFSEDLENLK